LGFEADMEPRAGDVSICAGCRGFLVWDWIETPATATEPEDAELRQRKLSPREFNDLPGDTRGELLRAQAKLEEIERNVRKPS